MNQPADATVSDQSNHWTLVVALAENDVIGHDNQIPFRLRSDLRRFKRLTMGHCLLMGRRTFESIGRVLPGRQTVVLSRSGYAHAPPEVTVLEDVNQVAAHVESGRQVMVVGGAQIYALCLPYCSTLWVTRVAARIQGDVRFPSLDWSQWRQDSAEQVPVGPQDEYATEFQVWTRRDSQ